MADSVFLGDGVEVDAAGGLSGDGTAADPLAVEVDGVTLEINGSNDLALTGALPTDSTVTVPGIGVTSTDGLVLVNTTDAAAGAQQYSPRLRLRGEGWKTDATAASQTVDFAAEVQPVQGTSAPSGNFILKASINGGAFFTAGTFDSAGNLLVPGAYILGSADTSGVRLDLESGDLAVREGDDSAAGNLKARDITSTGTIVGVSQTLSNSLTFANRFRIVDNGVNGAGRFTDISGNNTYDITLADWGTTLSAEEVTVADNAVLQGPATAIGTLTIALGTDNNVGVFILTSAGAPVEVSDPGTFFSVTKDTASSVNVYYETGAYRIQNLRGGARAMRILLIGG